MKRIIAFMLAALLLLTSCSKAGSDSANTLFGSINIEDLGFSGLNDPRLLQYINDAVYSDLDQFFSDDYIVDNVSCIYKSKEYLEDLAYNSQENIFFGYTLSELEAQFEGKKYVFTVNERGETTVKEFDDRYDIYNKVIRNVAIGTGVILICVTVSAATGGTASVIMAASAKTATSFALSSAAISGISTALVTGIETGDFDKTVEAAALKASEDFMWGAITGAIIGGAAEAYKLKTATKAIQEIPSWSDSEAYVFEKYNGIDDQISFIDGEIVPHGTPGSTRPDVLRKVHGKLEAIEVKNYDLENSLSNLCSTLEKQIAQRVNDLPKDTLQRIVLDTRGRGYSAEFCESVTIIIQNKLANIYADIPVDILF